MDRRRFLEFPLIGLPLAAAVDAFASPRKPARSKPGAIVVSTWDSGRTSNGAAWPILKKGGTALDAVEAGGRASEDEPSCCVGLSAWPDRDGRVTLDSCVMKGSGECGGVAFLERIKHPVSVARRVMEKTPHVLMAGAGAQQFAVAQGFPLEDGKLSDDAQKEWTKWLEKSKYQPVINIENTRPTSAHMALLAPPYRFDDGSFNHDTMGTLAMDTAGKLAGMVTTSGMAFKMRGRVGDSPLIGAGLFVDDEAGAATSSGVGEEVIRICGTHTVVEQMRMGRSPEAACREAVMRIIKRDPAKAKEMQVGFVALTPRGAVGAFSIQKGFSYTLTSDAFPDGKVFQAKSYFAAA